nr:phospholipase D-like domain-containing protein [Roseomonas acroporae]
MLGTVGLSLLHVVLSALVTAHVLLRKRDVASATGWIGLIWLSPFVGSALYYLLGINRVRERARASRPVRAGGEDVATLPAPPPAEPLAALDRTALRLTGRPAEAGNAVTLLHDGDEAYPRMLAAIEGASSCIDLSSYILRDDAAGAPFLDSLIAAHRRGVAVRVLVDGIGGGYFASPACRRLWQAGVPAARFMHSPLPWNMPFLNLRSHKKILVVDRRIGFTGGLNIGAENLLRQDPPDPVRDVHFALCGPVVRQLAEAFDRDWRFVQGSAGTAPPADEAPRDALADAPRDAPRNALGEAVAAGVVTARVVTSGPNQDVEKIELLMLQAITCARHSVRVATPYFLPDERLVTALALAALRGVAVDIVVPERSNHPVVDRGMHAHVGPLLAAGCRVWLNPPPFDHSKLMVVDGAWSLVGSSNWDMRSLRLNFELNVEIYDAATAAAVEAVVLGKRGGRLEAEMLARRSLPARLRDAAMRLLLPYV